MSQPMKEESLKRSLERIANLELGPTEVGGIIRNALKSKEDGMAEDVCRSLIPVVWTLLQTHDHVEMYKWCDLLRKVIALTSGGIIDDPRVSGKVSSLEDLLFNFARLIELYEQGFYKTWTDPVRRVVQKHDGWISYEQIKAETGYIDGILLHTLSVMTTIGELKRSGYGKTSIFTLP